MLSLAAYANRLSVRPGETIEFKVSSQSAEPYAARLVRVICADANPAGPGLREEAIRATLEGQHPSRKQAVHLGSYANIENNLDLGASGQVAFAATIWPTTPGSGRRQGILSAYDPNVRVGFALAVGEDGSVEALLGATRVKTRVPLSTRAWYRVWATYDSQSRVLKVGQVPLMRGQASGPVTEAQAEADAALPPKGMPWIIGALGGTPMRGHFNGKIERPMIFDRVLSPVAVAQAGDGPNTLGVVASWDFSQEMSSARVVDTGPHGLHGALINLPARAMTGAKWTGREMCFRHAPKEYAAIHFHDDDLHDCGWQTDFSWQVPEGTRSGVYAVRLTCGDAQENVPFFVLPPKGRRTSDLCVLMSTYTYTVYHNHGRPEAGSATWMKMWSDQAAAWGAYPYNPGVNREYGLSTYNFHSDGSGICHASWLRPMLTMRCGFITYPDEAIRGSGLRHFPADTHLIAWLEAKGYSYDIITDEDLDVEGYDLIKPYRTVMTGSHPEYHTGAMLDALQVYRDNGGRLVYLGGNGFYWKVARHKEAAAAIEIRRGEGGIRAWAAEPGEYYNAFDGEYGGLWRRNGRPPQSLVGVGFTAQGNFVGSYYRRGEDALASRAAWILDGVADEKIGDFGLSGHGAAGFELDRADHRLGTPRHAVVIAQSEGHKPEAPWVLVPEEQLTHLMTWAHEPPSKLIRADMTFFETPGNGAVFSTGSITFCGSLPFNNFENNCSQVLKNVLDRFLDPGAKFPMP
ncbi:MAG: LamG domain-containing protein [Sphingomonadales bacterium]|nr:LamG domain-containing protein [Sphingomonadales bacterium]